MMMYELERSIIDEKRRRFDQDVAERSTRARETGREYLDALAEFVDRFNDGPGSDPRLLGLDTTGELRRVEEQVAWAEEERRRVRHALDQIS